MCGCHLCMAVFCVRSDDTIRGSSQTTSALMFWKKEGENVNGELVGMIQYLSVIASIWAWLLPLNNILSR